MKVFVARVACSLFIAMAGTSQAATSTVVVAPTASMETLRQQIKANPRAVVESSLGLTASVASLAPHRGAHRVFAASVSESGATVWNT